MSKINKCLACDSQPEEHFLFKCELDNKYSCCTLPVQNADLKVFTNNAYVRLPCDPGISRFIEDICKDCASSSHYWDSVVYSLNKPHRTLDEWVNAICYYSKFQKDNFTNLYTFFEQCISEEEANDILQNLMPRMAKLALQLPELIQCPIPLLNQNQNRILHFNQEQIACLMANAFFCTFPAQESFENRSGTLPNVNFSTLYKTSRRRNKLVPAKFHFFFNYFSRVCEKTPIGTVSFFRRSLLDICPTRVKCQKDFQKEQAKRLNMKKNQTVNQKDCNNEELCNEQFISDLEKDFIEEFINILPNHFSEVMIIPDSKLEECKDASLFVDFASDMIGGGILRAGSLQEELRFLMSPELIVSRLFTQRLQDHEVLFMSGAEKFNIYGGYGNTFYFDGNYEDTSEKDEWNRRANCIVAMNATNFSGRSLVQYESHWIIRELRKAYCAFLPQPENAKPVIDCTGSDGPVATGNWGCGAYGGDEQLKFVIQLLATTAAKRSLRFALLSDGSLSDKCKQFMIKLQEENVSPAQLCKRLFEYSKHVQETHLQRTPFFEFI